MKEEYLEKLQTPRRLMMDEPEEGSGREQISLTSRPITDHIHCLQSLPAVCEGSRNLEDVVHASCSQ